MLQIKDIHYRLYEELDTFSETGYCSYWKPELQFLKPTSKLNNEQKFDFPYIGGCYLILEGKLGLDCQIKLFYDGEKYYYHHYEDNQLKKSYIEKDYLIIHQIITFEMKNYQNILLSY